MVTSRATQGGSPEVLPQEQPLVLFVPAAYSGHPPGDASQTGDGSQTVDRGHFHHTVPPLTALGRLPTFSGHAEGERSSADQPAAAGVARLPKASSRWS